MTLWNPNYDNRLVNTIDRPCNFAQQFLIRDGVLDITVYNRSNDVLWGLFNANVVQFSIILEFMAKILNVKVGYQIHMINSLHLYFHSNPQVSNILANINDFNIYDIFPATELTFNKESFDPFDNVDYLDSQFREFFKIENKIKRERSFTLDNIKINYLRDALRMAFIFAPYKRNDLSVEKYGQILDSLKELEYPELFISCLEFLNRSFLGMSEKDIYALITEYISLNERLIISEKQTKALVQYVITH